MILFYLDCGAIILGAVTLEVLVCIIFMPRISLHPTANLIILTKHDHKQNINSALRELPRSEE